MSDNVPPVAEVVAMRRLLILKGVVGAAMMAPPPPVLQGMMKATAQEQLDAVLAKLNEPRRDIARRWQEAGLWEEMTEEEGEFLQTPVQEVTQRQVINMSWRIEAMVPLLWALALIDAIPAYDSRSKVDVIKAVPARDMPGFIAGAALRDREQIERARDIAEFWHWRSRTRQLVQRGDTFPTNPQLERQGIRSYDDIVRQSAQRAEMDGTLQSTIDGDFAAFGKSYRALNEKEWAQVRSITMERHLALNWLCGYAEGNRWEKTPTGT